MGTRNGFTFIEFVLVIAIIALLAAVVIPFAIVIQNHVYDGRTEANMHKVQLVYEEYASQNDSYPFLGVVLMYMRNVKNPWTGKPVDLAWDDRENCSYPKGTIVLSLNPDYIRDSNVDTGEDYRIRAVGHDGKFLSLVLKDAGPGPTSPGLPPQP